MALNETRAAEEKASPAKKREPEPPKTPPYGRLAGQFWISLAKHVSKSDAIDWLQRGRVDLSTPEKLARELERARTRISSRRDWLYEETLCDQHGCHEEVASVGVVPWMPQVTHLARIRCLCTAHRTSPGFDHVQDLEGASIDLAIAELAFRVKRGDFGGEPAPTPGPSDESPKAVRKRRT